MESGDVASDVPLALVDLKPICSSPILLLLSFLTLIPDKAEQYGAGTKPSLFLSLSAPTHYNLTHSLTISWVHTTTLCPILHGM